ncbi:hypothetical protein ACET3Z_015779 [Daucus carota]
MAIHVVVQLLILPLSVTILFLYYMFSHKSRNTQVTNWPVLGMAPALIKNYHKIHEFATQLLKESNGTFKFQGPSVANLDFLVTSDPANIHYILSKNFNNYPKGPEFHKIFDILGNGIQNVDDYLWEIQRKTNVSLFNHANFHKLSGETLGAKVKKGLIPLLDHVSEHGIEVDLQDVFQRLAFDNICMLVLDHDPQSLSLDLPDVPAEKASTIIEVALYHRHVLPESLWRLQSLIGFGKEKSLSRAWKIIDEFIYKCISLKRQDLLNRSSENSSVVKSQEEDKPDLLKTYMESYKVMTSNPDKFLRDVLFSLLFAGQDSTSTALSWFFWLVTKNPSVESKILQEIQTALYPEQDDSCIPFNNKEDLRKLVYLQAALSEALRLFPPVALEHKAPLQPDILPSGHRVDKDSKIVLSFYSVARMENVWGKDCLEFRPERWITEKGGIKHEASYKFPAFNAGPRSCLGKEMAFTQMKMVAANIIHNYKVEVVDGHPIVSRDSIILQMKHGLKVRMAKKSSCST